ncbi:glycosyltransferase family 2 protein [Butyrivibrio sp. LB2008]|uniref:glycosyltransferase family 2 protein n=1 Tax=Butyrivibrio sp. LB2008 TaxID=1408305 RepID=UPI00047ED5B0|nr:glycosyltransferase family 2 protein [Butyrivibrio sp. LB2008]
MTNKKVSIVIPIYNCEKYIGACLDSIIAQSYKNFEVICVDDGSADNTGTILGEYEKADDRIKIVSQNNLGVVTARYNGIKQAVGEYLMFVDSDDYIYPEMLECMLAQSCDSDLVASGLNVENKNGIQTIYDNFDEGEYNLINDGDYFYGNMIRYIGKDDEGILPFSVGKLFRTSLLFDVFSELDVSIHYAEDRELVYSYLLRASSVKIIHKAFYFYRYNNESVLRCANPYALEDVGRLYRGLFSRFKKHDKAHLLIPQLEQVITSRLYLLTKYMGFAPIRQTVRFIMPYFENISDKKLVLYGAGVVGCNYYKQTLDNPDINWVLWVDKNSELENVSKVSELKQIEYDYIIVAVMKEAIYKEIAAELNDLGIRNEAILWKPPVIMAE